MLFGDGHYCKPCFVGLNDWDFAYLSLCFSTLAILQQKKTPKNSFKTFLDAITYDCVFVDLKQKGKS